MAAPVYLLNIGALLALKILGHRAKGAEIWFALGPLRLQPAEFMKIGMVLMLAKFFHDDYRPSDDSYGFSRLWKPVLIGLVPMGLVLIQPDLGTTMMLLFTAATVILVGKGKRSVLVAVAIAGVLLSVVIWNDYVREPSESHRTFIRHLLKHHQSQRIASWLDPGRDLRGSNYHSAQSKIAVGSGGLTGTGWGHGTQTGLFFLPDQQPDFIFSVWTEEHGFLLCLLLMALYGCIVLLAGGVRRRETAACFSLWAGEVCNREFAASLRALNLSVSGAFLQSSFFLPIRTELRVSFALDDVEEPVQAGAQIVREQRADSGSASAAKTGFGIRFLEFYGQSEVTLAKLFLGPRLRAFAQQYLQSKRARTLENELERTVDTLAAWELLRVTTARDPWRP